MTDKKPNGQQQASASDQKRYWLDKRRNVNLLIALLVLSCVLLASTDLIYKNPHPHFPVERWIGFYGIFGFLSFTGIVLAGKWLRPLVKREEGYYDR